MSKMNLIAKVKEVTSTGLPFMEGRENSTIATGQLYNIVDYGYLQGDENEFVVFITREEPKKFFYGGSVVTEKMKKIDAQLTLEERHELLEDGLEVVFQSKMSKNKKKYTCCDFFPTQG